MPAPHVDMTFSLMYYIENFKVTTQKIHISLQKQLTNPFGNKWIIVCYEHNQYSVPKDAVHFQCTLYLIVFVVSG